MVYILEMPFGPKGQSMLFAERTENVSTSGSSEDMRILDFPGLRFIEFFVLVC